MKKTILILLLLPIIASAQSFNVFDIDTSEYPIMKAKFYSVDENGDQILNLTTSDFEITENSNTAEVLSVSCPEPKQDNEIYSIAMSIDISGSMRNEPIQLGKITANDIVKIISNSKFKISVQQCNDKANILNDFINNYDKVKENIKRIEAGGDNDFVEQLLNPNTGLLNIAKNGEGNRIAIIYTDAYWGPMTADEMKQAIDICKYNDIKLYTILYTKPEAKPNGIKASLKEISEESGGRFYDGVTSFDLATLTAFIVTSEYGNDPCEITWNSTLTCDRSLSIEILNKSTNLKLEKQIRLSNSQYLNLISNMYLVDFGTNSTDTTITITANNGTQIINDIQFVPDNSDYKIITPLPVTIPSNGSIEIELKITAADDSREYTKMEIIGNYCNTSLGLLKGNKNKSLTQKTLNLIHPNGGEKFIAGSDTIITWEGVSDKEKININFSSDNGLSWTNVDSLSFDLKKNWSVPNLKSDECLIKLDYENSDNNNQIKWKNKSTSYQGERLHDITIANDFNVLTTGTTEKSESNDDLVIRKIDLDGNTIWEKFYGSYGKEAGNCIVPSPLTGFLICGGTTSKDSLFENSNGSSYYPRGWVLKLDIDGEIEWHYHDFHWSIGALNNVLARNNGKIIISGWKYYVAQMSEFGEIEWEDDNSEQYEFGPKSIIELKNGEIVAVGNPDNSSYNGTADYYIVKYNELGEKILNETHGGNKADVVNDIVATDDYGFIILVSSNSYRNDYELNKGRFDIWLLKYNDLGDLIWRKNFGGPEDDRGISITKSNNGNYLISALSGEENQDIMGHEITKGNWFFEVDDLGNIQSQTLIPIFENNIYSRKAVSSINNNIIFFSEYHDTSYVFKISSNKIPPLQSDTSDAVFSIIMPEPVIQNNDIDMGEMIVGNTKDTIVSSVICNTGDAPLHVLGVDITGGDDIDFLIPRGAGDFYLEKDECQDMMFEFTPSELGNRTAVATIRTTIGDFTDTINIRGVGINPLIEATTDVIDFGQFDLGEGKDTNVVLIKNIGADDIIITETKITGPDIEQFDMVPLPSFTLPSGDDKELELNYAAKYGGRTSSIIEFHYDGVGSPLRSMLFAEGIGGEVYPQVRDAYVGERVELGLHLGRIKPEGLDEVATNFKATVSYNSTLLAPIDKNMSVTTENTTSFIEIEGKLSGAAQIATVPMKVGLGTAVSSGLVVTEFQLYDVNGDSVDYEIEPGVGEFNVLGICEEGGTRLINPNGEQVGLKVAQNQMNTNATVSLNLIESGQTDLIIYDQLGNAIETAYSGTPSTGTKELNIDLSNFANGRYYIKLVTPTVTKTEIIEVVR